MSSGYDDERDDRYDERDDRDDRGDEDRGVIERGRKKVATPALLLVVVGLIGVLLEVVSIALIVAAPTIVYDAFVDFIKSQPQTPQQQQQLKDMEAKKDQMRLDSPTNIASAGLGLVLNLVAVVGGLKMRSLSGYGLSMAGAIAGIIPVGGCCCLTLPVGIWALVVLMNEDVKTAFARNRAGRGARGEY